MSDEAPPPTTHTQGQPQVTDLNNSSPTTEDEALNIAEAGEDEGDDLFDTEDEDDGDLDDESEEDDSAKSEA